MFPKSIINKKKIVVSRGCSSVMNDIGNIHIEFEINDESFFFKKIILS